MKMNEQEFFEALYSAYEDRQVEYVLNSIDNLSDWLNAVRAAGTTERYVDVPERFISKTPVPLCRPDLPSFEEWLEWDAWDAIISDMNNGRF